MTRDGILNKHTMKDVIDMYQRNLIPRFYEKKNLGQVFTPFHLINDIIDQIPIGIMMDPNSTFFDPSAGMGGFLVILYYRLMVSLRSKIKNKDNRHTHIVTNMLFAAEITSDNVKRMRRIFGNNLHIFHGDSLSLDKKKMLKVFGITQMRVIIGNPPFEKPQKTPSRKLGGDSLWDDFVRKSFEDWLQPEGYFGMVLPPGWRKASDERSTTAGLWDLMTKKNTPIWIKMFNAKDSSKAFNQSVSIRIDLVVIKKQKNRSRTTTIYGTDKKKYHENLLKYPYLPNSNLCYWVKWLTTDSNYGTKVIYTVSYHTQSKDLKHTDDTLYKYPVIHAIHKDGTLNLLFAREKLIEGGFGIPKLIFNRLGGWNLPVLDITGKYGLTQSMFAIPFSSKQDGKDMYKFFSNSKVHDIFQEGLNWSTSIPNLSWKAFRNIRRNFIPLK